MSEGRPNRQQRRHPLEDDDPYEVGSSYGDVYRAAKYGTGRRRLFARIIWGMWILMSLTLLGFLLYMTFVPEAYD